MAKTLDKEKRWKQIQRLRKRGMSERAIAHALGISPAALCYWLRTNRLAMARGSTPRKRLNPRQKQITKALALYLQGATIAAAAQACGVTGAEVVAARRKAGIKSRWMRHDVEAMMRDYETMTADEVAAKHETTPAVVYVYVTLTGSRRDAWAESRRKRMARKKEK